MKFLTKNIKLFLKDIKVKKELETLKKVNQDLTNFEQINRK